LGQNPAATYGQNVTAGNTLLAVIMWSSIVGNILSVLDSLNNKAFTLIGSFVQQRARTMAFYYLPGTLGGSMPTVTAALDSSQSQAQTSVLELTGYCVPDTPGFATVNGPTTTTPTGPSLTTVGAADFLLSWLGGGSVTGGPSGWTYHTNTSTANRAAAYLQNAAPGTYTGTWAQGSNSFLIGTIAMILGTPPAPPVSNVSYGNYMRSLSRQNMILGGKGASTSDNEFTLIARNNKLLGGPMASPAETVMSMLSKQNKLLGGIGRRANDNQFWTLVRTLKQMGGTAYPSDNVITLLRKINALL